MSYADERFIQNCREILTNGVWDTELEVRPHWEDGTPAHTVKKFGIVNRYDLREEFPILTLRRTYFKTCDGRAAVDLAEEVQQHPRSARPHLGQPGPTRPAPSARPTAISWR